LLANRVLKKAPQAGIEPASPEGPRCLLLSKKGEVILLWESKVGSRHFKPSQKRRGDLLGEQSVLNHS